MAITADSLVRDVLDQHPTTGAIFIQQGALFRNVPGQLYAVYDSDLTVEAFAARNDISADRLLSRLIATADADELARRTHAQDTAHQGSRAAPRMIAGSDIGYTSGHREPSDVDVRSVVSVQNSRGPI